MHLTSGNGRFSEQWASLSVFRKQQPDLLSVPHMPSQANNSTECHPVLPLEVLSVCRRQPVQKSYLPLPVLTRVTFIDSKKLPQSQVYTIASKCFLIPAVSPCSSPHSIFHILTPPAPVQTHTPSAPRICPMSPFQGDPCSFLFLFIYLFIYLFTYFSFLLLNIAFIYGILT